MVFSHWPVLVAGTLMMLIFWVITPLQSAVFGTGPVAIEQSLAFLSPVSLMPVSRQAAVLDQSVLNSAFAVTWLNQSYPPFVTAEYALLPFRSSSSNPQLGLRTNWTGVTTQLTTDLQCWPARISANGPKAKGTLDFDNGRGCNASEISPYNSRTGRFPYRMMYIGYQNSAWANYFLASPTCSRNSSNQFLAVWARFIDVEDSNVTATFCETSYFKQRVSVTVSADTFRPDDSSIKPLGPREPLPQTEFNSSAFEYLIGSGVSAVEMQRDWPSSHLLEQYPRVINEGLTWPLSPMIGFAVGGQNNRVSEYGNTTLLGAAFRAAHKSLFSMAVRQVLSDADVEAVPGKSDGTVQFVMYGVIISRLFSAMVEALLLLVALSTILLLWLCNKHESRLDRDPASLGTLIDVVQNSSEVLARFTGVGNLSAQELQNKFHDQRFRLVCACESVLGRTSIKIITPKLAGGSISTAEFCHKRSLSLESTGHYIPVRPTVMRREVGVGFIAALSALLIGLSYLKWQEQRLGGKCINMQSWPGQH
jgi:hypothetical protein